jgi:hypothetical protein
VKNDSLESFYTKINTIKSLLKYDFYFIDNEKEYSHFLVLESEVEYFSIEEISKGIACSDIGYSCNSFNFGVLNSLVSVDDHYSEGIIKYSKSSNIRDYDKIAISSGLAKVINKNKNDIITLNFYFDDKFHVLDNVEISEIINEEELVIYHSNYDYNLYVDKFNKHIRVKYLVSDNKQLNSLNPMGYEIVREASDYLNGVTTMVRFVFLVVSGISFIVLFILESNKLKKHYEVFRCLYFNNIEYKELLMMYLLVYLIFGVILIFDISTFIMYLLCFFVVTNHESHTFI